MKTTDPARDQVERMLAKIEPALGYLSRLSARIDKRGMGTEPLAADVRTGKCKLANAVALSALRWAWRAGRSAKGRNRVPICIDGWRHPHNGFRGMIKIRRLW